MTHTELQEKSDEHQAAAITILRDVLDLPDSERARAIVRNIVEAAVYLMAAHMTGKGE
ncbi:MAG: hypothetical protein WC294_08175 [Methanoregula sp.]|jgi:hypothetical protein